jgi:hypothetical protein
MRKIEFDKKAFEWFHYGKLHSKFKLNLRQSLYFDGDVPLDAGDFFARVVALLFRAVDVLTSTIRDLVMQLRSCLMRAAPP